jgi:N-acetylmuramoyl-L-alanine amidase
LAPNGEEILEEEEEIGEPKQVEVEILSTSTGFLRVRSEPSILGEEIGRVEPGERYPYLDEDEDTGWLKIEYEEGKEGWVSGQYAKKIEESKEEPSPSPSP